MTVVIVNRHQIVGQHLHRILRRAHRARCRYCLETNAAIVGQAKANLRICERVMGDNFVDNAFFRGDRFEEFEPRRRVVKRFSTAITVPCGAPTLSWLRRCPFQGQTHAGCGFAAARDDGDVADGGDGGECFAAKSGSVDRSQ